MQSKTNTTSTTSYNNRRDNIEAKLVPDLSEVKSKQNRIETVNPSEFKEIGQVRDNTLLLSAMRGTEEVGTRRTRDERGSSFSESSSSSHASSCRIGSNSSLLLDDGTSSDAGASSDCCYLSNGGKNDEDDHSDDEDLEQKIKFFFQRIEQQEIVGNDQPMTNSTTSTESKKQNNDSLHTSFNTKSTTTSILGKRKQDSDLSDLEKSTSTKRSKLLVDNQSFNMSDEDLPSFGSSERRDSSTSAEEDPKQIFSFKKRDMKASKKPDFDLSAIFNPLVKVSSGSSSSSTSSTSSSN